MDSGQEKTPDFSLDFGLDVSDDDDILAQACEESARLEKVSTRKSGSIYIGSRNEGTSAAGNFYPPLPESTPLETLPGFDIEAGKTWVYPINYPVRGYQYSIVEKALYRNLLVSLPTGLGKTFIAAVVMYNFYRWYPCGKVIFMAPTKPLVAQQINACFNVMGIPQEHTAEMTGVVKPEKRVSEWCQRRVFFLTPEVLVRDLARGSCPAVLIKCLVIDEAHHALGKHAYCQVIQSLCEHRHDFRIVALSATPGTDVMAVKQVLTNLLISEIELRNEDSTDIQPYTHQRTVEKVVVPLGDELKNLQTRYRNVLRVYVLKLIEMKVLYTRDETTLTKFQVLKARDSFRQSPPESLPLHKFGMVEGIFALCMTLYHSYELLLQHGTKAFFMFMKGTLENNKGHRFARSELSQNQVFQAIMNELAQKFYLTVSKDTRNTSGLQDNSVDSRRQETPYPYVISHPKMKKLLDIVTQHHQQFADKGESTRVIIFSQYRDSVEEITGMLSHHHPLVKAMSFVGHSRGARSGRGFSQKEQLQVVNSFRDGGYNTLVSTCVGEEGLDIGEVDLIVCYDAPKSPVRLTQRMGRTGRQRGGRIVVLITEGREEQMYNQSQYQKKSISSALMDKKKLENYLNPTSPRMVPRGITPVCMKLHMKVGAWKTYAVRGRKKASTSTSIASFLTKSSPSSSNVKAVVNQGLMSREEWAWYKENLKIPQKEVKNLPNPTFLCLTHYDEESGTSDEHTINLGTYHPWQTTVQSTHVLGHSAQSETLVRLAEFTGLQQHLDPQDDPYGLEMATFLDMNYVSGHDKNNGSVLDRPSLFTAVTSKPTSHQSSFQQCEAGPANIERKQNLKKGKVKGKKKVHHIQSSLITHMLSQKLHPKMKKKDEGISDFPDDVQNFKDRFVPKVKGRNLSDLSEQDEDHFSDSQDKKIQEAERESPARIDSKIVNDDDYDDDVICLMDGSCVESVLQDEVKDGGKSSIKNITQGNPRTDKANFKDSGPSFGEACARSNNANNARIIAKYDAKDNTANFSQTSRKSNPNLCVDTLQSRPIEMDFLLLPQLLAPFKVLTPPRVLSDTDSEIDEPESPSEVLSLCDDRLKNKNSSAYDICVSYNWLENESEGVNDMCVPLGSLERGKNVLKNAYLPNNSFKNKEIGSNGVCESQEGKVLDDSNKSSLEVSKEVFKDTSLLCTTRELQGNNTFELLDLHDHQGEVNKNYVGGNEENIDRTSAHRLVVSAKTTNLNTVGGKLNSKELYRIEEITVKSSNIEAEVEMSPVTTKKIIVEHSFEEPGDKVGVFRSASEQTTVFSTPSKSPNTIGNTLKEEISPILSSTYKKPVRTNIPLCSSTPKVNAKRLFKVDTPPLNHLSISSVREGSQDMNIMCNANQIDYKVNKRTKEEDTENEENITSDRNKGMKLVNLKNDVNNTLKMGRLDTVSEKSSEDRDTVSKKTEGKDEISVSPPILSQRSKIRSKLNKFTFTEFRLKDSNVLSADVSELNADLNAKSKGSGGDRFDLFSHSNDKNARNFPLQPAPIQEKEEDRHICKQDFDLTDDTEASSVGVTVSEKNKEDQTTAAGSRSTEAKQLLKTLPSGAERNQTLEIKLNEMELYKKTLPSGAERNQTLETKLNEMELNKKNSGTNILQGTIPVHNKSDVIMDTNSVNFDLMLDDDLFGDLSEADFDEVYTEVNKGVLHNNNVYDRGNTEVLEMNTVKNEYNKCAYNEVNKCGHNDEKNTFSVRNNIVHSKISNSVNNKLPHHSEGKKCFHNVAESQVNHSNPALLGITQIIDLVDSDSPEKEGKMIDDHDFDTTKNVGKMTTMTRTSKKNLSALYQQPCVTENVSVLSSVNLEAVMDIGKSKSSPSAPQSSSVFKCKRSEVEPSQQMPQKSSCQVFLNNNNQTSHKTPSKAPLKTSNQTSHNLSVDFNLLGEDELELMSESLLVATEGDIYMEKKEGKIKTKHLHGGKSSSERKGDGSSVLPPVPSSSLRLQGYEEMEDLGVGSSAISHKSPGNLFQRHTSLQYTGEQNCHLSHKDPKLKPQSHYEETDSKASMFPVVLDASEKSALSTQDESHVWQRKKRKFVRIVESDNENTLLADASDVSKTSMSTSSDHSLCFGNKLKNRNFTAAVSFEEDGDFVEDLTVKYKKENSNVNNSNKPRKRLRSKTTINFLETEAEVSHDGDEVSSDETDCEGELDSSFVDDCTQLSQDPAVDMKAVYLQSVGNRDDIVEYKCYRPPLAPYVHDTDESHATEDMSDDSFVVDNSHIEYDTEYIGDSMLAEDPIINQAILDKASTKEKISKACGKGTRKRIIVHNSSSDDDELEGHTKRKSYTVSLSYSENLRNVSQNALMVEHGIASRYDSGKKATLKASRVTDTSRKNESPDEFLKPSLCMSNQTSKVPMAIIKPQKNETTDVSESSSISPSVTCMPSDSGSRLQGKPYTSLPATAIYPVTSVPSSKPTPSCSSHTPEGTGLPDTLGASQETCSLSQPSTNTKALMQNSPLVILVDSGELGRGGSIVTGLRLQYGAHTAVLSISPAHYVISTRMAVVRLSFSAFSSQQQRGHLVTTLQSLLELYDRPVVLVETDRDERSIPYSSPSTKRSRYLDTLTCAFVQVPQVKLLYSNDQEETRNMLAQLMEQERTKGYSIPVLPQEINKLKQMINFYRSLPQTSTATALTLAHSFVTIADFINSSTEDIRLKCSISQQRAEAMKQHLTRRFRKDMLPK